jgi:hypothetical protein
MPFSPAMAMGRHRIGWPGHRFFTANSRFRPIGPEDRMSGRMKSPFAVRQTFGKNTTKLSKQSPFLLCSKIFRICRFELNHCNRYIFKYDTKQCKCWHHY